jgi:uroporphyrinogen decarboxylase
MMFGAPDVWDALMRKIAGISAAYLAVQVAAGASAVQLFDSWAGALTPADYGARDAALRAGAGRGRRARVPAHPLRRRHRQPARADGRGRCRRGRRRLAHAAGRRRSPRVGDRAVQGNLDPTLVFAPTEVMTARAAEVIEAGRAAPRATSSTSATG